jgi:hypothetical protein
MALTCVLLFPKMALGLSGFEMSMVVMPLVQSDPDHGQSTLGRVRNVRKMLVAAAGIMALLLLASALVTTILVPREALAPGGRADNRALAYLAHGEGIKDAGPSLAISPLFGEAFGTVYDLSAVLILCLAGASVMIAFRDLVPPYLHRLGMELPWAHNVGAVVHVFNLLKLVITVVFLADVSAQRGAFATSVLMLMTSAAAAAALDQWRGRQRPQGACRAVLFGSFALVFLITALAVAAGRPQGVEIAVVCIVAIVILSVLSRLIRTNELRLAGFRFADEHSRFLWESMQAMEFPVLVPHRPGRRSLENKEDEIRARHRLAPTVPIVFLEAELGDPSEFYQLPIIAVTREKERYALRITRCSSIAHAIAAIALELSRFGAPPEIHFGWSDESPIRANLNFVLFGEGNVPWMVRELVRKAEPRPEKQPRVVIG